MTIMEAFAQGIRDEAPTTKRKLAEYRASEEYRQLPPEERKIVGLLAWIVKQIAETAI